MMHHTVCFSFLDTHVLIYFNTSNILDAYIFGGYDGTDIFGDLWRLDLDTLVWKRLPNDMAEPAYFKGTAITPVSFYILFIKRSNLEYHKSFLITPNLTIMHLLIFLAWSTFYIWWSNKH